MKFGEAFNSLGYKLKNIRGDWSAEKETGVCITLWDRETDWHSLVMDTRIHAQDIAIWRDKSGNRKRILHARRAIDEFDGWIDVTRVNGQPGVSYGNAKPWDPASRKGKRWRVTFLDENSGHIRLEAQ